MTKVMVMIGTEKGAFLLRSDARREKWEITGPLLPGWKVGHLILDTRQSPRMFASTGSYVYGPTINVSDDLGKTWRQIENGPKFAEDAPGKLQAIWCVTPGPADAPETLYAGVADAGLFISRNRGESWEELPGVGNHPTRAEWFPGAGGLCCHTIIVHPTNHRRIWVGISAVGVLRSDDGGQTWEIKNEGVEIIIPGKEFKFIGSCVHRLVLDPEDPERLYQQNHKGVFRSRNGGDSWERIENGLPGTFGFPMIMHPHHPRTLFVIPQQSDEYRFFPEGRLTVYRTSDAGDHWEPLRNGLPEQCYAGVLRQAMAADTLPDTGIYFGTSGGQLFYSRNNGEHWHTLPYTLPRINSITTAMLN